MLRQWESVGSHVCHLKIIGSDATAGTRLVECTRTRTLGVAPMYLNVFPTHDSSCRFIPSCCESFWWLPQFLFSPSCATSHESFAASCRTCVDHFLNRLDLETSTYSNIDCSSCSWTRILRHASSSSAVAPMVALIVLTRLRGPPRRAEW